jgi:hypothetical protein
VTRPPTDATGERALHWYPWWSPRFWHGMPLRVWLPLLATHRYRVSPRRWGLLATITGAAVFNSLAEPIAEARFRRQLRSPPRTDPPLFIIGHWRSGTTLLHELLMLDERFCCPNTYQCFVPGHFLLTEGVVTAALAWMIPKRRPMDDVVTGWDRPQEDEFALFNMGAPSPYERMAFPVTVPPGAAALDLTTLPPDVVDRWRATFRRFLARLAVRDPRRPVLKSPPHTARMAVLADMFPGAKFLHVVRDPFIVFPSTMRLWRSLHDVQGMQVDDGRGLEEQVFTAFETMYAAFERDRPSLPEGSLHELRYEELVADPFGSLERAYAELDLGGFDQVRPALEARAAAMQRYRTNTYRHDPRIVAAIGDRWRGFLDRYGYQPPPA